MTRPPTPPPSPFGLGSRFGASKVPICIVPVTDSLVYFDLKGLHERLYTDLNFPRRRRESRNATEVDALVQLFEDDPAAAEPIIEQLETAWESYRLRGAVLAYKWRDEVRQCLTERTNANLHPVSFLRARHALLVLNVLARVRANILMADAPLALERSFLERELIIDDPRVIELARATGYVPEPLDTLPKDDKKK